MKLYLYISPNEIEYLSKVLQYHNNIDHHRVFFSFSQLDGHVMISMSINDYTYLKDQGIFE